MISLQPTTRPHTKLNWLVKLGAPSNLPRGRAGKAAQGHSDKLSGRAGARAEPSPSPRQIIMGSSRPAALS